jgi:hypothetical protein
MLGDMGSTTVSTRLVFAVAMYCLACVCPCSAAEPTIDGTYVDGDGLGYNITLTLGPSGEYEARWNGCLGAYGTAKGTWAKVGDWLVLQPTEEKNMLRKHLRRLRAFVKGDSFVFVREQDLKSKYFRKYGADRMIALHRQQVAEQ